MGASFRPCAAGKPPDSKLVFRPPRIPTGHVAADLAGKSRRAIFEKRRDAFADAGMTAAFSRYRTVDRRPNGSGASEAPQHLPRERDRDGGCLRGQLACDLSGAGENIRRLCQLTRQRSSIIRAWWRTWPKPSRPARRTGKWRGPSESWSKASTKAHWCMHQSVARPI
jgi:hypothetical protein